LAMHAIAYDVIIVRGGGGAHSPLLLISPHLLGHKNELTFEVMSVDLISKEGEGGG